jgi:putative hydrolase of the HAD superfamily
MRYRAVIFDLGGVVLPSPFDAFRAYERQHGLPGRFISEVIVRGGEQGAWSRLERGELGPADFAAAFAAECEAAGGHVDADELLAALSGADCPHPKMVAAIGRIRDHGLFTAALTNNWADEGRSTRLSGDSPLAAQLAPLFDTIVESALVGMRKPDPRIYHLVCELLAVTPRESIFLDDLGANLKPARAMGMATIKVTDPATAIAELAKLLALDLGAP